MKKLLNVATAIALLIASLASSSVCASGTPLTVEPIRKDISPNSQLLVDAIYRNALDEAAHLINSLTKAEEKKVLVNAFCTQTMRPLHVAAFMDGTEIITLLLDNGADIEALNEPKQTPLKCAMNAKKYCAADVLIARGATVWPRWLFGSTRRK